MQTHLDAYIDSKKYSWSNTTKRSERARLNALGVSLNKEPENLYEQLIEQGMKPYSIKTTFLRLKSFYDYLIDLGVKDGPNFFYDFINKNRRIFKYAYDRKPVKISFEEAVKRIENIQNDTARGKAFEILRSGLRLSEYRDLDRHKGRVRGKGGKYRTIHVSDFAQRPYRISDTTFRRELKRVGLCPHDLRKLFATRLLQKGMNIVEVQRLLGHSSITTTEKYIQDGNEGELHDRIGEALKC